MLKSGFFEFLLFISVGTSTAVLYLELLSKASMIRRAVSSVWESALEALRKTGSICEEESMAARPSKTSTDTLSASASLTKDSSAENAARFQSAKLTQQRSRHGCRAPLA